METNISNKTEVLKSCKLYVLKDQEFGDVKLIIYKNSNNSDSKIVIILSIGEDKFVITNQPKTIINSEASKKLQIALNLLSCNCDLPEKLEFKSNDNILNCMRDEIVEIITENINCKIEQ